MASKTESPSGIGTTQSPGTLTYAAYPPSWSTPRSYPVTSTASPGANRESLLDSTVPDTSMPPMIGNRLMILPAPVPASASL